MAGSRRSIISGPWMERFLRWCGLLAFLESLRMMSRGLWLSSPGYRWARLLVRRRWPPLLLPTAASYVGGGASLVVRLRRGDPASRYSGNLVGGLVRLAGLSQMRGLPLPPVWRGDVDWPMGFAVLETPDLLCGLLRYGLLEERA